MARNETRGIRWGELLPLLQSRAEAEGVTVAEIARRSAQEYLKPSKRQTNRVFGYQQTEHLLSSFPAVRVRLGPLTQDIVDRAIAESSSVSSVLRRAARLYLSNQELPKIEQFRDEVERFRRDLARVGGNLNQIAVHLNYEGQLKTTELGRSHIEMRTLFASLIDYFKLMERSINERIP